MTGVVHPVTKMREAPLDSSLAALPGYLPYDILMAVRRGQQGCCLATNRLEPSSLSQVGHWQTT